MGLETLAVIAIGAATLGSIYTGLENAEDEATAAIREGELKAKETAKAINAKAAAQKVSFLSSGFSLEGTPNSVLSSTFEAGRGDVGQILSNYETQANSIMSKARAKAITDIAMFAASFGMPAGGGTSMGGLETTGKIIPDASGFATQSSSSQQFSGMTFYE